MTYIQRAINILIGGLLVAYLLNNVRAQQISFEQLADIDEVGNREYPALSEEESLEMGA
jgi:hypothetical protein